MNCYLKKFMHRGLIFGGFGPIIVGIVFMILDLMNVPIELTSKSILIAIVSTYLLAFIQAGSTVFEEITYWSISKRFIIHLIFIYLAYMGTYCVNFWIPRNWISILIFSISVILVFTFIWLIIYFFTGRKCCDKASIK